MDLSPPKGSAHKSNSSIAFELPPTPAAIPFSQILQSPDAASRCDHLNVRDVANDFKHGSLRLAMAGQETIADPRWVEAPFVLLAALRALSLPSDEVRPNLRLMTEVVRNHRVNVRQGD